MGILDKLSEGAEKVAKEAEKVFEQGKTKVEELQLERQMDSAARKLGYLEYDVSRGRTGDPGKKEELIADLFKLELQLSEMREGAAGTQDAAAGGEMAEVSRVETAAAAAGTAPYPVTGTGTGADTAQMLRMEEAAAAAGVAPTPAEGEVAEDVEGSEPRV